MLKIIVWSFLICTLISLECYSYSKKETRLICLKSKFVRKYVYIVGLKLKDSLEYIHRNKSEIQIKIYLIHNKDTFLLPVNSRYRPTMLFVDEFNASSLYYYCSYPFRIHRNRLGIKPKAKLIVDIIDNEGLLVRYVSRKKLPISLEALHERW